MLGYGQHHQTGRTIGSVSYARRDEKQKTFWDNNALLSVGIFVPEVKCNFPCPDEVELRVLMAVPLLAQEVGGVEHKLLYLNPEVLNQIRVSIY